MDAGELSRYSRQIILPGIGVEGQEQLRSARVLIIGMGGLGSPAALYLAAAGVGTLGLADFDTVAGHNLQRQILHDDASAAAAEPKLESARKRLLALDPRIRLELHPEGVTSENAVELFSRYDVIVDGTDNFPTRYRNNDAAFFARRPLVHGTIFQFEGQVTVFDRSRGSPCYRCLFPEMPEPGTVPNCEEAGVFGALCGVVGSWQAMETLKLITGVGSPLLGRLLVTDALHANVRNIRLKPDPDCPLCGSQPRITTVEEAQYDWHCIRPASPPDIPEMTIPEIDVTAAASELHQGTAELLDVREPFERDIVQVPGSLHIPMGDIPSSIDQLPRDRKLLVICHHGGRSQRVAEFLRGEGFNNIANVSGGIDLWAVEVDPQMQRY